MRYTCLDVMSPDVNFLRKVMSSSRHDGAAYSRHPCRQSADADIVSAFPLSFSTFLENINILRQTSSTWHRIRREFCVLESFQKPVTIFLLLWWKSYQNSKIRTKKLLNQEFLYRISSFCTLSENSSFLHGKISCFCIFLEKNSVFNTNRTPRLTLHQLRLAACSS